MPGRARPVPVLGAPCSLHRCVATMPLEPRTHRPMCSPAQYSVHSVSPTYRPQGYGLQLPLRSPLLLLLLQQLLLVLLHLHHGAPRVAGQVGQRGRVEEVAPGHPRHEHTTQVRLVGCVGMGGVQGTAHVGEHWVRREPGRGQRVRRDTLAQGHMTVQ